MPQAQHKATSPTRQPLCVILKDDINKRESRKTTRVGRNKKSRYMFIAAMIIYVIVAFLVGPFWPLQLISGKAGPLGILLAIGWFALLIGGMGS